MYPKNAASPPRIAIGAVVQISDGAVQSSGVSIAVRPEGGSESAGGGTTSYGGSSNVVYYVPTQAETNYTAFVVTAYKTGCIPVSVTVITTESAVSGRVSVGMINGDAQSVTDLKDLVDTGYDPVTHSIVLVQTTSVNSDMRGTDGAYTGTPPTASAISTQVNTDLTTAHGNGSYQTATGFAVAGDAMTLTSGERTSLAAVIWNSLTSGFLTVGSIGKRIVDYLTGDAYARLGAPVGASMSADIAAVKSDAAAILIDTDELQSSLADGGRLDLIFDSILVHANSLDATKITTERAAVLTDWIGGGRLDLTLDTIATSTSTSIPASIAALGSPSQAGDEMDLVDAPNATAIDSIVLALLKRDWTGVTGESARSMLNALRALRNKFTVAAGTYTVTKEDDSTTAWTASVTTDASADPITGSDPS